ncbi:hypothetical protein BGX31_009781 [Mortierella sp. GBA43]|nr:hypothetical protein BGX31_009781 [Mortierella sp. GBA43]
MGDTANSKGMQGIFDSIREFDPEVFIYSIHIGESEADDQKAGYFGNVNQQIEQVCKQLKDVQELQDGFNAVGFSQGGQFLRAYVQRCNDPPVHNLITVGSQHNGVADIPGCIEPSVSCKLMRAIAKGGVYNGYVQGRLVQAQYYKDPRNLATYLEKNIFLPDINNELAEKNPAYKERLISINKLVMFMFQEDVMVKPKETSWFGFQDEDGQVINLEDQDQYKEDWLGLKTMDENDQLVYDTLEGQHMQFSTEEFTKKITLPYLLAVDNDDGKKRRKHRKPKKGKKHRGHGMVDQSETALEWDMDL